VESGSGVDGAEFLSPAVQEKPFVESVKVKLAQWQYLTDPEALEIVLATAVAIYLPGDPLWTLVVGPSGGGKTEMLSILADSEDVMMLSKLTSHTLMSGLTSVEQGADLIYQLNEKLLVIKDLAPILQLGKDEQKEILSDLRDAYDGYVKRAWGSGKGTQEWRGKFGLLATSTPAIDRQWMFVAELGERYVRINLHTKPEEQTRAALALQGQEDEMREQLRAAGKELMAHYKAAATTIAPKTPMYYRYLVGELAQLTGVLRTGVIRDRQHDIQVIPQPEVGTRLGKQFLKLAESAAFLYYRDEPGEEEFELVLRAAIDAIPPRRQKVLAALLGGNTTVKEINSSTNIPNQSVKNELEDLALLGVASKCGKDDDEKGWAINERYVRQLEDTGLAEKITRDIPPEGND